MASYKKRPGTSGISGQLYETNLISLILFMLHQDTDIEDFSLASNMDDIGAFDDICIKIKLANYHRPIYVFVQAKHKDEDGTFLHYELIKHFNNTFMKVKRNFYTSKDVFFKENFSDIDTVFVLYTNAKFLGNDINGKSENKDANSIHNKQNRRDYVSGFSNKLNSLISTGELGSQADYNDEDLALVNDILFEEEINNISEHFAKFLSNKSKQSMNILLDDYLVKYHVILTKHIVDVSKIKTDGKSISWRELTFNSNFFNANDKLIKMFRKNLYTCVFKTHVTARNNMKKDEIVKEQLENNNNDNQLSVDALIATFLSEPCADNLSPLIGTHIIYKSDKLQFTNDRTDVDKLEQITVTPAIVQEAEDLVAKKLIMALKINVPVTFGNVDLAIGGNEKKVAKRLFILTEFFRDRCKEYKIVDEYKYVTIHESVGEGFLSLTGGIGSAVGNLLIYDDVTELLKFTDEPAKLPLNARILYASLISIMDDLHVYRFDVNSLIKFPKLVIDFATETRQILKKIVVYDRQGNHKVVAEKLKKEIEKYYLTNHLNIPVKADTITIFYHHEIQKWWMSSKTGIYLTKSQDKTYQNAINNIVSEPQISAMLTTFYTTNFNYFRYRFNNDCINAITLLEEPNTIVASDIPGLTVIKLIQCLKDKYNTKNAVLDFEYILNLEENVFSALKTEIKNTDKVLLLVCSKINNNRMLHKRLDEITTVTENKKVIVVVTKSNIDTIQQYFHSAKIINDDEESLNCLTEESQKYILENARIIFQGEDLSLAMLVDNTSVKFIKGAVFNKIICNKTVTVGKFLTSRSYEEIKHLYVDRKVSHTANNEDDLLLDNFNSVEEQYDENIIKICTFNDIDKQTVLITAKPGMGKSTLLTHLALKTQNNDIENKKNIRWIERINLLDYSKVFHNWQKNRIELNRLEMLKFMCEVILKNSILDHSKVFNNWYKDSTDLDTIDTLKYICTAILNKNNITIALHEENDEVFLKECTGDTWATFELNIFLNFYNESKLIFAFDGFDEICPHYKDTVIELFNIIKKCPKRNKIWVTSRPYLEILPDLERVLGKPYVIQFIDDFEQDIYLNKYWEYKIAVENFNDVKFERLFSSPDDFLGNIPSWDAENTVYIHLQRIYYHLRKYLYSHLSNSDKDKIITSPSILYSSEVIDPTQSRNDKKVTPFKKKVNKFLGTPLLLHLLVDYFIILIDDIINKKFEGNINVFVVYKQFIETKLKKILLQDKLKIDVYMPGIITRYENELNECINMHKNLAAYVMFKDSFLNDECRLFEFESMRPFNDNDEIKFDSMVNKFRTGTERTGLISYISADNIPVFVHRTFAEYFATEFASDIFKSTKYDDDTKKLLFITIYLFNTNDVFLWLSRKVEIDTELRDIIKNFISTMFTSICRPLFNHRAWSIEQFIRLMASSTTKDFLNLPFGRHAKTLHNLTGLERDEFIIKFHEELLLKMSPNLKKHFTSPWWPVNSAADYSKKYPLNPLRKHLDHILKKGFPYPFGRWYSHLV